MSRQEVCLSDGHSPLSKGGDEWKALNSLLVSSRFNKWSSCWAATVAGCGCSRRLLMWETSWMSARQTELLNLAGQWIELFPPGVCFATACLGVLLPVMGLSSVDCCLFLFMSFLWGAALRLTPSVTPTPPSTHPPFSPECRICCEKTD